MKPTKFGAAIGIAAIAAALTGAPAASATKSDGRRTTNAVIPELSRLQMPLTKAARVIRAEVERGQSDGYAGIELEDHGVAVWWKGEPPQRVKRAVSQARLVAPVQIHAAAYSLKDLQRAGATIRTAWKSQGGIKPRIKYAVDGSHLTVAVQDSNAFAAQSLPDVEIPIEIVYSGKKVLATRYDDWAPWSGGADLINGSLGARCTGAFGVRNSANARYILTAGHCGRNGDGITDGAGEWIGTFSNDRDDHDIALVSTWSVDPSIYVGGVDSNAITYVEGWDWVYPGEYLCQSGGTSARVIGGPVCDLRVERFNTDPGDAVEARQIYGQTAVRGGDSGGPVYSFSQSGNVIAKGVNNYTYIGNDTILGFQDFGTATRDYGIWIAQ